MRPSLGHRVEDIGELTDLLEACARVVTSNLDGADTNEVGIGKFDTIRKA